MNVSLNKNMLAVCSCVFVLLSLLNCYDGAKQQQEDGVSNTSEHVDALPIHSKQEEDLSNSKLEKIATIEHAPMTIELAGNWLMTMEQSREVFELAIIPADTSYVCREAPCFLFRVKSGKLSEDDWPYIGMSIRKRDSEYVCR